VSLQRIDLNLFRVFEAILQQRSVIGAAKTLGVTPSAVSHALSRLRRSLDDELFVHGEDGMEPTPRALELAPSVRDGLGRIDDAIAARPFVPSESNRTFRISASDYGATTVLPPLIRRLCKVAPQVELRVFPYNRIDVVQYLDEGRIDVVIGWFADLPQRMRRTSLLVEKEAVVVRRGHPLTEGPVTLERLLLFPYVVVEVTGSEEQAMDGFVDERGVWRRVWIDRLLIETSAKDKDVVGHVAVSLPHYAAVPDILCGTDMVATLPERLALRAVDRGMLAILDLPYDPLIVNFEAIWHHRADRDAGLQWLLGEMADAARSV
jgi:DNA-binding transcriptional LysR family regulator